jgi:hypothetical protein
MERKIFVTLAFLPLVTFSLVLTLGADGCAQSEQNPLIVNFSYAPDRISKGEIWKIYLSVSDPEGRMKKVTFTIDEAGATRYRPSFMYLKKGMEKEFAGYFALLTAAARDLSGIEITLNLSILDDKENVRRSFSFPVEFDGKSRKPLPPELEKDLNRRIGNIGIDLDIPD